MDKQQEDTSEWCSFEVSQVPCSKSNSASSEIVNGNSSNGHDGSSDEWNANFDPVEVDGFNDSREKTNQTTDEATNDTVTATQLCFCPLDKSDLEEIEWDISKRY